MKKFTLIACALFGFIFLNAQDEVTYTDNFETDHDYLTESFEGTIWEGYYVNTSENPDEGNNNTMVDTFMAVNGGLKIQTLFGNFEHVLDDGAYIYRTIPGGIDFVAEVMITDGYFNSFQDSSSYYNSAGIIVRNPDHSAQNNLYFMFFELYNIHSMIKSNVDGAQTELVNSMDDYPALSQYPYIRATRAGNLFTLSISSDGFSWIETVSVERTDFEGIDLEIGLTQCNFWTDNPEAWQGAVLDDFRLTHAKPAGISDKLDEIDYTVYAVDGRVNIESRGSQLIQSSKLYSIDGREIASLNNVQDRRCEFNNLSAGLYITVVEIDGRPSSRKVIVQ